MLGGTNQEQWIQKVYLFFLLTDPTKKPQFQHSEWARNILLDRIIVNGPYLKHPCTCKLD
jgi:hypothetical protein